MNMKIDFVDYNHHFLELSFAWLADEEIKYMTLTPSFSKESQEQWFASLPERKDYYIRGILANGVPIGACGLKHITKTEGEYWGYIGEKAYWGKGIGKLMMATIEQYAHDIGLVKIYLHVREDNERAIRLYASKGYLNMGIENSLMKMCKEL